jgi:hypothetical protein
MIPLSMSVIINVLPKLVSLDGGKPQRWAGLTESSIISALVVSRS